MISCTMLVRMFVWAIWQYNTHFSINLIITLFNRIMADLEVDCYEIP